MNDLTLTKAWLFHVPGLKGVIGSIQKTRINELLEKMRGKKNSISNCVSQIGRHDTNDESCMMTIILQLRYSYLMAKSKHIHALKR